MTLEELREQIADVGDDWEVRFTTQQSMKLSDPNGADYVYVFDDGRPPRHLTDRRRARALKARAAEASSA